MISIKDAAARYDVEAEFETISLQTGQLLRGVASLLFAATQRLDGDVDEDFLSAMAILDTAIEKLKATVDAHWDDYQAMQAKIRELRGR